MYRLLLTSALLIALALGLLFPLSDKAAELPQDAVRMWKGQVSASLERVKYYPELALARSEYGLVRIKFTLDRSGRVVKAEVVRSSCYPELDAEALALVRRAQPFPTPPDELTGETVLMLPVRFKIHESDDDGGCAS
jgi:protein TonB